MSVTRTQEYISTNKAMNVIKIEKNKKRLETETKIFF